MSHFVWQVLTRTVAHPSYALLQPHVGRVLAAGAHGKRLVPRAEVAPARRGVVDVGPQQQPPQLGPHRVHCREEFGEVGGSARVVVLHVVEVCSA